MNYWLELLFFLLFIVAFIYIYKRMEMKDIRAIETITTKADRKNIFCKISMAFYMGAILIFAFEYVSAFHKADALKSGLLKALILLAIGITIRIVQNIHNESLKELLTIIMLVSSIPIALLQFFEYASVTIWAFPMIIIITSIIFSKSTLLVSATIISILTQIVIWSLRPAVVVVIDRNDYLGRIGLITIAFLMASYINKLYFAKIRENTFQTRFQKMNAKISSDFINVNKENIDEKFNQMLSEMGMFFKADRISLFSINQDHGGITYSYEWCHEGVESKIQSFQSVNFHDYAWWKEQLDKYKVISIGDTRQMPKAARKEQEQLHKLKIKSVVSVPIEGEKGFEAFLIFSSVNSYRKWPDQDIKLLHIMANLLSDALLKIKSEKEVEYMAYYDALTDLPNRHLFQDRATKAIDRAKNTGALLSIIYLGLDNFKSVNGIIGYEGGDQLLKQVAKRLTRAMGQAGEVARFNGDEFIIRLKNIDHYNEMLKIANCLLASFEQPFDVQGQEFIVTASAGIASYPLDGEKTSELIENAHIAMQHAKEKGKSQYALCTATMKEENQIKMSLLNDLYGALERDELVLYYQPQVDVRSGQINGAEALIRWNHPQKGIISPGIFIPLAEENGLINSIGKWVLKTVCMQNIKWQDMNLPPLPIGVNISAAQLIDVHFMDYINHVLAESGLDPKYLELEITESMTIDKIGYIEKILQRLKEMGLAIAIDDFGTDHSSFSRLKTLPIDRIKIDMEFVQGIEASKKDRTITEIIINLAKSLGLNVIAEGVETKEQLAFLKEKDCDDIQGYYYYKPMPTDEFEDLLRRKI